MKQLGLLTLFALLMLAGCTTTGTKSEWGTPYTDVPVPAGWEKYDTPPFKRTDGSGGKRIFGRYSYQSGNDMANVNDTVAWFKAELPTQGWSFQSEEIEANLGKFELRFKKDDDILLLKMAPDEKLQKKNPYSVLVVEMNPQYD